MTFEPKPVSGDWNGTGCHSNFSTESTRGENGYDVIIEKMEALSFRHKEHIAVYGSDNETRLTGKHETSSMDKFNYGISHRGCSVRIPAYTVANKKGYLEDRRPAGNCDPYLVGGMLVDTICNDSKLGGELVNEYTKFVNRNAVVGEKSNIN